VNLSLWLELSAGFVVAAGMTFVIVPWLIPKLIAKGMVGVDLNKPEKPNVAEMGGIAVVIGFFSGVSVLIALNGVTNIELLYISLTAAMSAAFVGIMDDIFDLRHRQKAFFPFLLAIPLGATLDSTLNLPLFGEVEVGFLMILAAPFAVTCAANAGNMLEGFNGLGTSLGIIMASTLAILAVYHEQTDGLFVLIPLIGGLTAFLWFNKYPARIFPGDTLMLFMGATIAIGGMLSSLYIQTTIIFIPMIVEFFLKLRGGFKAENYCSNAANGYLEYKGSIESITHVFMKHFRLTERRLVSVISAMEGCLCLVVIVIDVIS
jgi:UDP-N-acetylglucosamine--dolichyl-phosphate N-acetylglucosaminephosphotransferase